MTAPLKFPTDITNNDFYVQFEFKKYIGSNTSDEAFSDIFKAEGVATVVGAAATLLFPGSDLRALGVTAGAILTTGLALTTGEFLTTSSDSSLLDGVCILPIPEKIVDGHNVSWSEVSITDYLMSAAPAGRLVEGAAAISSTATGVNLNPFNRLYFQKPNFREFNFNWKFAAHNQNESIAIQNIIKTFKTAMSPTSGIAMGYPYLVDVKFNPNNLAGGMELLQCAIAGINADFNPHGSSFIKDSTESSGHPTLINFNLKLKETQLWWRERYEGNYSLGETPEGLDEILGDSIDQYVDGIVSRIEGTDAAENTDQPIDSK